jgi:hypothetical protein
MPVRDAVNAALRAGALPRCRRVAEKDLNPIEAG